MPNGNVDEPDIIFQRPRKEGGSLVLTIPKHICDKLRIADGSRLHLVVYHSFVVVKHGQSIDYNEEPLPKTFELLDSVFSLFEKEKELKKLRFSTQEPLDIATYDSQMKEIVKALEETNIRLFSLLKVKKSDHNVLSFGTDIESPEDVMDILRDIYDEHYGSGT